MNIRLIIYQLFISFFIVISFILFCSLKTTQAPAIFTNPSGMDSLFKADSIGGWQATSTYLNIDEDSVDFQVILFRNTPDSNDWKASVFVGTLDSVYSPAEQQIWDYSEPTRTWKITLETDGKCYLELIGGSDPDSNPAVIPIKTRFKK